MRKRIKGGLAWLPVLAVCLALTACARQTETAGPVPVPGLYLCRSITIRDLDLDPARKWLRLLPDGSGVLYLSEQRENGTWTLEGDAFLWTPQEKDGRKVSGTWSEGVLTLALGEMSGIFVREGVTYPPEDPSSAVETGEIQAPAETGEVPAPEAPGVEIPPGEAVKPVLPAESAGSGQTADPAAAPAQEPGEEAPSPAAAAATYPCYGGLYYVDYDPQRYQRGPVGGADLLGSDGTTVWFSRMPTRQLTDDWLSGMAEKGTDAQYLSYESCEEQAAGCPVQAIVYQDETAWHAEAVVDLGEDRGTEALPMYAVYITCHGPSRDAVWTDGTEAFLSTLWLGKAE